MPVGALDMLVRDDSLHIIWPENVDGRLQVRYTRLNFPAEPAESHLLDVGKAVPRYVRLLALPEQRFLLLWASRLPGTTPWGLRAALLDSRGALEGEAYSLVPPEAGVGRFDAAALPSGDVAILWTQSAPAGVYAALYRPGAPALGDSLPLADAGENPALQVDRRGVLHLAWTHGVEVRYAALEADLSPRTPALTAARMKLGTGSAASRPVVGLEHGRVYLLWSVVNRSGLEAGTGFTAYVTFPMDAPLFSSPRRLYIPPVEAPSYRPVETAWPALSQLAAPAAAPQSSDFVLHPAVLPGEDAAVGVALTVRQAYRLDAFQQIAVGVLDEGAFQGYAFVSRSQQLSDEPHLAADTSGYWHVIWRDGAFGQRVFYTTNEPEARQRLDALTAGDFINAALEGGLESLTSILLLPIIGFGWILPGLVVLGLWKLLRDDESVHDPASWPALLLGLGVYQGAKWISLPAMTVYVPFSAWLDVPPAWRLPLQVSVPPLILAAGIILAVRVSRRHNRSTVLFYLVTALVDALFTLAVYGVILLGVY